MPEDMKVSVIILSHNGEKVIEGCLSSVISTDYEPLEIILVENGSTDKTYDIAEKYRDKIEIIRTSKNLSFSRANNLGLKRARGEILVLLNDDTVVTRGWIRAILDVFEHNPRVGIAGCKMLYPDSNIIQHYGGYVEPNGITNHYGKGEPDGKEFSALKSVDYVTGAAFALRRGIIDVLGYLPEVYKPIYFEEVEYCVRARKKGWDIVVVPDARVYHLESQQTVAKSFGFYYKYHKNRIRFVLRNVRLQEIMKGIAKEIAWVLGNLSFTQLSSLTLAYSNNFFFTSDSVQTLRNKI